MICMYLRTDDIWICWFGCCAFVKPSSPHLQTSDINASFGTSLDFSQNNLFIFQLQSSAYAGGPFSSRQKRHFSAYYRIKLKSILIIKMIISVMKIVIFLMIMVMKMTKNRQIPCLLSQNIPLLGTIT